VYPVLLSVGPVRLYSYTVLFFLAFIAAWAVARRVGAARGLRSAVVTDLVLATAIGGVLGARALYVADYPVAYVADPLRVFMLQQGGLVFYGGLAGGAVAGLAYALWRRLPLRAVADTAAVSVPLGAAIGRVGCFLNGCCGGKPTALPIGVTFPGGTGPVLPAQLIDAAVNLAVFGVLLSLSLGGGRLPSGGLAGVFAVLYSAGRFFTETLRVDPVGALGLTQAQLVSVALFVAGVTSLAMLLWQGADAAASRPGDVAS
jgi:phosphatidylglycerol:prolipoprotein diacylglycerol transferase